MSIVKSFKCFLAISMFVLGFSCTNPNSNTLNDWMRDNQKAKVLSTTEMINDLVIAIGKDKVDSLSLIIGDLDPHSYEIVKGDDEKIKRADLVIYNGLGLEHGASLLQMLQNHENRLAVGDVILSEHPQLALHAHQILDPHIWMDVSLWARAVDPITEKLSKLCPEHAKEFSNNAKELKKELSNVHEEIFKKMQSIPSNKRYLVTSHDAFQYFARAYLKDPSDTEFVQRFSAPEGLAPDGQLSSSNIKEIVDHLQKHDICVLFPESNVSQDSIRKILHAGEKMGMHLIISKDPLYGDAMQVEESLRGTNYIHMMKHNARIIEEYLNR